MTKAVITRSTLTLALFALGLTGIVSMIALQTADAIEEAKQRARERYEGVDQEIDIVFDNIMSHSRGLQDHVRAAFEEAGAKVGEKLTGDVDAQLDEQRKTVQLADTALLDALNDFRARRRESGQGNDLTEEIATALQNTLDTPDDPRFDDELRRISEGIAALS